MFCQETFTSIPFCVSNWFYIWLVTPDSTLLFPIIPSLITPTYTSCLATGQSVFY